MSTGKPLISILIPTRNRCALLRAAVASVVGQTSSEWELIIADNHSEDDTESFCRNLGDPRIRVLRAEKPLLVHDNWNRAYAQASGDLVLLLGDDDWLLPTCVHELADAYRTYNEPFLIVDQLRYYFPDYPEPAYRNTIFYGSYSGKVERISSEPLAADFFRFKKRFHTSAVCIARPLMDSLRTDEGLYIAPFPDYFVILSALLRVRHVIRIHRPLVIIGTSGQGLGTHTMLKSKEISWKQHPLRSDIGVPFPGNYFTNGSYQVLRLVERHGRTAGHPIAPSMEAYLKRLIDEIHLHRDLGVPDTPSYSVIRQCFGASVPRMYWLKKRILSWIPKPWRSRVRLWCLPQGHWMRRLPSEIMSVSAAFAWLSQGDRRFQRVQSRWTADHPKQVASGIDNQRILVAIFHPWIVDRFGQAFFKDQHGRFLNDLAARCRQLYVSADRISYADHSSTNLGGYFDDGGRSPYYRFMFSCAKAIPIGMPAARGGIIRLDNWQSSMKKMVVYIRWMLRSDGALIYAPSFSAVYIALIARVLRKPYVLYVASQWAFAADNYVARRSTFRWWVASRLLHWVGIQLMKHARFTLTTANNLLSDCHTCGARAEKTRPLLIMSRADEWVDREFGSHVLRLLTVANLNPVKDFATIFHALRILKEKNISFRYQVVGSPAAESPTYIDELHQLAKTLGIAEQIEFLGPRYDVAELISIYRDNEIFILASIHEGFPKVAYEAGLQHLLLCLSDLPSYEAVWREDELASFFPPGDANALASSLIELRQLSSKEQQQRAKRTAEFVRSVLNESPADQFQRLWEQTDAVG